MLTKTTICLAAFALVSLTAARSARADVPPPVACGTQAGASCTLGSGDPGICVEQSGSINCVASCDPTSGAGCCDPMSTGCCGTDQPNGVCKSVPGGHACDTTDAQTCGLLAKGDACTTEAGEAGSCETSGGSVCSFLVCKPAAAATGSTTTSATSSTSATTGSSSGGGGAGGSSSGTAGGSSGGGGCSIEGLPARAPLGMGLVAAALGAASLRRRRRHG